jgi:purine-binding chemotaxis protein CheW
MDLAKIRQKSRLEREHRPQDESRPSTDDMTSPGCSDASENAVQQAVDDTDFFEVTAAPVIHSPTPATLPDPLPLRRAPRDPLEAILAGRALAGCEEITTDTTEEQHAVEVADYLEYLCFRVSDEVYGINIMEIKELIKPREVTEVPRAPSFVSGVISLRGTIIPIIDMLDRLGLSRETVTGRERVIVVRHAGSFSGLLVDEIIQVVRIARDCMEAAPTVLDGIDRDFVAGIGRADGRMIIILNLENITDIHLY